MSGLGRLSTRDLERLSAYLDGQLSRDEASRLEARLRKEPTLRETLEGLRLTQAALRSLPSLRPPRNFTLTAQMAGVRPRRPAYPALRLATALATVAFLLVSGVDVLTRGLSRMALGAAAPAPPVEAPMLGAAPANEGLVEGEQPPQERALAGELTPTPPALQAFADALAGTPTAAEEGVPPGYGGREPPEATAVGIGGGGPLPTTAAGLALPPSKTPTPTPTPSPTPTATATPIPQLTVVPVEIPQAGGPTGLGPLRWAEILLGAAVVVFAVFSLWFRREA